MVRVEGVDQTVISQLQDKTQRPVVHEGRESPPVRNERQGGEPRQSQEQALERSVRQLNQSAEIFNIEVRFQVDREKGETYVLVIDREKGVVIRRIPPDDLISSAREVQNLVGMIVNALV